MIEKEDSVMYKQCLMKKGMQTSTAWIPEKFAIVGKYLKIEKEDGWLVKEVYECAFGESVVNSNSRDYLRTRIASDI